MIEQFEKPVENIRQALKKYIEKWKINALVIGVSGGIDSALCCALARPVCDELNIPLIGRSISIDSNKEDEKDRARKVGSFFCTNFKEVDLTDLFNVNAKELETESLVADDADNLKIRRGNLKARLRMIYLYNLANAYKGMVLSTDNYTELLLGFWTLHGDVGDYGMIQNLWKTEVYRMVESFLVACSEVFCEGFNNKEASEILRACVEAVPTDGLGISNSDLDQIMPDWNKKFKTCREAYEEVDKILLIATSLGTSEPIKKVTAIHPLAPVIQYENPVIKRYYRAEGKRNNPVNIPREIIEKE